ncbi:MAG TPA: hypothetical protein VKJ47_01945 [Candidatus Binatia bacterium]|nr:hypothetical protein [Candidatus Binatia bacterium]
MLRHRKSSRSLRLVMLGGAFAVGFLCGALSQQRANAQLKELGGAMMQQAGQSGGTLGSVAQLASSLTEMQDHVTGLQKNIDTLRKVQSALGGK